MTKVEKLNACLANDVNYDGVFYYAVKTTGIFCKPSCPSKAPLEKNILFFSLAEDAMAANFRPCKRCRPDLAEYKPLEELAAQAKKLIDEMLKAETAFAQDFLGLGVSRRRIDAIFKEHYGLSVSEYTNKKCMESAVHLLASTNIPIVDIAYAAGFESISSFYRIFGKYMGQSPALYRKTSQKGE